MATLDDPTPRVRLADLGASHHTTHDAANFSTFTQLDKPYTIKQVQGEVTITHWGTVDLITTSATGPTTLHLQEVLYIPTMTFNLLSLQRLIDNNVTPLFNIIPSKAILNQPLPDGNQQKSGLMTVNKGQMTLDYTMTADLPSAKAEIYICEPCELPKLASITRLQFSAPHKLHTGGHVCREKSLKR